MVTPQFKQGKFEAGILAGTKRLIIEWFYCHQTSPVIGTVLPIIVFRVIRVHHQITPSLLKEIILQVIRVIIITTTVFMVLLLVPIREVLTIPIREVLTVPIAVATMVEAVMVVPTVVVAILVDFNFFDNRSRATGKLTVPIRDYSFSGGRLLK